VIDSHDMNGLLTIFVLSVLVCYSTANERHARAAQILKERLVRSHNDNGGRDTCYKPLANCTVGNYTTQVFVNLSQALQGNGSRRSPDIEAAVNVYANISLPTVCNEFQNTSKCVSGVFASAPPECQQRLAPLQQRFNQSATLINYLCGPQLSNLQAAQKCFNYDLVGNVTCCGIKEHFSSNCSAQHALSCAQNTISKACGPAVAQSFSDILTQFANIYTNGSVSLLVPVCGRQRNYEMQWLDFF
jgi:hypothetical protein